MIWVSLLIFSLFGGWLSRMCGGAPPKLPLGAEQWLYGLPYLLIMALPLAFAARINHSKLNRFYPETIVMAYFLAVTGKRTGHGGGMDLGHSLSEPDNGRTKEKVEYLIYWLHGRISRYWYDALLLSLTGLFVTIPAGLVIAFINPFWGVFLALSGITKPIAYIIGWAIYPTGNGKGLKWLNEASAIGEFGTGFGGWGAIGITAIGLLKYMGVI